MNFIWFVLATVFFYVFYWYILSLIIFLPSVPIVGFIGYLTEHTEKKWAKIALLPTFIMSFLLGILLPSALFGMGVGVITLNFAEKATHPLIYFFLGGLGAFIISAPSGETSLPAMLISLATYVITVRIPKFALFSAITVGSLANIVLWGVGLLIFVGIAFGVVKFIVGFLDRKISKRTEIEIELKRETGRKLSIGVYILSIIFIALGGLWVISYLIYPTRISLVYFIWGVPYLVSGIGMLRRKYWALRFSQVFLILIALQAIVAIPIGLLETEELNLLVILILLFILSVFIGLPIWFLFRRSTVNQFKKSVKDSKNKEGEKEGSMYIEGIKVDLTEEDIKEAIDLGKKIKESAKSARQFWHFGSVEDYKECGSIGTKFWRLAELGFDLAKKYESPKRTDIDEILNSKELRIVIVTYGDWIYFAQNYHVVLKQGGKVIRPVDVETGPPTVVPESRLFSTTVWAYFRYSDIDVKAKTIINLIKDKGESRFEVDFSRYK